MIKNYLINIINKSEIGPYKIGIFEVPKINVIEYMIYMLIYTLTIPFVYNFYKKYKVPKILAIMLIILYFYSMFYFFGIVTFGYIIWLNTKQFSNKIIEPELQKIKKYNKNIILL